MCAGLQLQLSTQQQKERNNNIYYKKAKSFWQSYESVGKIIDEFLFGESKKKELICKFGRKLPPCLNHFETFHSRVILTVRERKKNSQHIRKLRLTIKT